MVLFAHWYVFYTDPPPHIESKFLLLVQTHGRDMIMRDLLYFRVCTQILQTNHMVLDKNNYYKQILWTWTETFIYCLS